MKLIIVDRSKRGTFAKLKRQFEDDLDVEVVWERRIRQLRKVASNWGPERRSRERRKLVKGFNGRDYIVIYTRG